MRHFLILKKNSGFAGCSHKAKSGFTLVEVMVALMVLLMAASGILASFIVAKRYVSRARRRIIATNFARQRLESLLPSVRQDTWLNPANPLYDAAGGGVRNYNDGVMPGEFGTLWTGSRRYTVRNSSPIAQPGKGYRDVAVTVTWNEPSTP